MITDRSQRWRDRRTRFVPAASEIDPQALTVDVIDTRRVAAPFVKQHHYSASMPVAQLSVGLFRNGPAGSSELVGVCVFSVPVNDASVAKSAGLQTPRAACDLGRLVLLDDVGGNGETFLVARALRLLRRERPQILSVISYADPVRRVDLAGRAFLPGHVGTLYAVMGSLYGGAPARGPISSCPTDGRSRPEPSQRYATPNADSVTRSTTCCAQARVRRAWGRTAPAGSPPSSKAASCDGSAIPDATPMSSRSPKPRALRLAVCRANPIRCSTAPLPPPMLPRFRCSGSPPE